MKVAEQIDALTAAIPYPLDADERPAALAAYIALGVRLKANPAALSQLWEQQRHEVVAMQSRHDLAAKGGR